jgi:hypothetical protein
MEASTSGPSAGRDLELSPASRAVGHASTSARSFAESPTRKDKPLSFLYEIADPKGDLKKRRRMRYYILGMCCLT